MNVVLPMPELEIYLHTIYPKTKEHFSIHSLRGGELEMIMHVSSDDY